LADETQPFEGTISGVAAIYNQFTYIEEMQEAVAAGEARIARLLVTDAGTKAP
jgi:hypothetical protein